ncbi:MAG: hypothetical protein KDA65_01945 [Planctomycetaceae bacterium]|nr:hypothetical protein [Planctomycetaceae bacterium]
MSTLKIYRPDQAHTNVQPMDILSFRRPWESRQQRQLDEATLRVLSRAKLIRDNRECPCCNSASVLPIELDNAILNRNRLPIPGSATLVGFRCTICDHEWPAHQNDE